MQSNTKPKKPKIKQSRPKKRHTKPDKFTGHDADDWDSITDISDVRDLIRIETDAKIF